MICKWFVKNTISFFKRSSGSLVKIPSFQVLTYIYLRRRKWDVVSQYYTLFFSFSKTILTPDDIDKRFYLVLFLQKVTIPYLANTRNTSWTFVVLFQSLLKLGALKVNFEGILNFDENWKASKVITFWTKIGGDLPWTDKVSGNPSHKPIAISF